MTASDILRTKYYIIFPVVGLAFFGLKKYKKYYTFIDESDTYYTALILDPRVKGDLILKELDDIEAGNLILKAIRDNLHQNYQLPECESSGPKISNNPT